MTKHIVAPGECVSSIAKQAGLPSWRHLYLAPENADFRRLRPNPDVIYPGDVLFVPEKKRGSSDCTTEKRHRFRAKAKTSWLRLRLQDAAGKALSNRRYILEVGNLETEDQTDDDGMIEQSIHSDADDARLVVYCDDGKTPYARWNLALGQLDPIEEVEGIQQRLGHLGFPCGPADGILGPHTEAAIRMFQECSDLEQTGQISDELRAALKDAYGC